jgi:acetyltransferase-like isoleucine patch superfamily enzyme
MRRPVLREEGWFVNRFFQKLRLAIEKRACTPLTMAGYLRKLGAQVGDDCFIVPTAVEEEIDPRLLTIGNHVAIAAGVSFRAHDVPDGGPAQQPLVIGDNCFIGYRAIIYPGVRIGANSIVAAGSVVLSDVAADSLVMGIPARPFGSVDRYREKCLQRWALQRPPDAKVDPGETWWTSRHHRANRELLKQRLLSLFHDDLA